jgi:hypothetical protein
VTKQYEGQLGKNNARSCICFDIRTLVDGHIINGYHLPYYQSLCHISWPNGPFRLYLEIDVTMKRNEWIWFPINEQGEPNVDDNDFAMGVLPLPTFLDSPIHTEWEAYLNDLFVRCPCPSPHSIRTPCDTILFLMIWCGV